MKKNEVKKNNKGFSLVELIVVIAIMAVLVGVLAPQFMKYVERSRESTDIQNMQQIITAVETYVAANESDLKSVSITSVAGTQDLTLDATTKAALKDAGLSETQSLKSKKWSAIEIKFDSTNNKWSYSGTADYYKIDGNKKS